MIRQLAEAESCVIIGRCADYVLKEFDHVISLFFYAPREDCIRRVQEISSEPEKEIIKKIEKDRQIPCRVLQILYGQRVE